MNICLTRVIQVQGALRYAKGAPGVFFEAAALVGSLQWKMKSFCEAAAGIYHLGANSKSIFKLARRCVTH